MASYTVDIWERIKNGVNYWVIRVTGKEGEIWLVVPEGKNYNEKDAKAAYTSVAKASIQRDPDFTTKVSWPLEDFTLKNIIAKLKEYNSTESTDFKVVNKYGKVEKYYLFGTETRSIFLTKDGNPIEEIATTQEATQEEKLPPKITPIKKMVPTLAAEKEEWETVTERRTIDVSVFTKNFKPGEVGIVGGKYTVVYLKNEDVTTALVFNPTSNIKITNLGDGRVRVEGVGRNDEWTKVIVNTEDGTATLENGGLVGGGVYRNWEYAAGKTTLEAPAAGRSKEIGNNQSTKLGYTNTYERPKRPAQITR